MLARVQLKIFKARSKDGYLVWFYLRVSFRFKPPMLRHCDCEKQSTNKQTFCPALQRPLMSSTVSPLTITT